MAHSADPPPCLRAIRNAALLFSIGACVGFLFDGSAGQPKNVLEVSRAQGGTRPVQQSPRVRLPERRALWSARRTDVCRKIRACRPPGGTACRGGPVPRREFMRCPTLHRRT